MPKIQSLTETMPKLPDDLVSRKLFRSGEFDCEVLLYSPYPKLQMVIFLDKRAGSAHFTPEEMERIANFAVKEFNLSPAGIVWIEYRLRQRDKFAGFFNLVKFDWYGGKPTNPRYLPIQEDWHLAWLENVLAQEIAVA